MARIENSKRNILYGLFGQLLVTILAFINRTIFIYTLGVEYLGLSGLFTSILSMLSLAELGVGSAITFSLYKPLADADKEKIKSLMKLYKTAYRMIGCFILVMGLGLIPFLKYIVNFDNQIDVNYYSIYILYLFQSAFSYLFYAYKGSILTANQQDYVVSKINYRCSIISAILQGILLYAFRNYYVYLMIPIVIEIIRGLLVAIEVDHRFNYLKEKEVQPLDEKEKKQIGKNIYALMATKISGIIYSASDNIVISTFLGTINVGIYSNYLTIINIINMVTAIIFGGFRASIGNLNAEGSNEHKKEVFRHLLFLNGWIVPVCTICLYQLINDFILLMWGDIRFKSDTVFLICMVFFVPTMNHTVNVFKDACGLFWQTRYRTLATAAVNIVTSVLLVQVIGINGVFCGTILAYWLTIYIKDPRIVCKEVLKSDSKFYYYWLIKSYAITLGMQFLIGRICGLISEVTILGFIFKCILCFGLTNVILILIYIRNPEFHYYKNLILKQIKKKNC